MKKDDSKPPFRTMPLSQTRRGVAGEIDGAGDPPRDTDRVRRPSSGSIVFSSFSCDFGATPAERFSRKRHAGREVVRQLLSSG